MNVNSILLWSEAVCERCMSPYVHIFLLISPGQCKPSLSHSSLGRVCLICTCQGLEVEKAPDWPKVKLK